MKLIAEKQSLEDFIFDWEEAEKIRRKKKIRIARIEKSEEEIAFESGEKEKEKEKEMEEKKE